MANLGYDLHDVQTTVSADGIESLYSFRIGSRSRFGQDLSQTLKTIYIYKTRFDAHCEDAAYRFFFQPRLHRGQSKAPFGLPLIISNIYIYA